MPYAIITGASKGIGKDIAEELARRKYNLVLVARSESLLMQQSEELARKYSVDVMYKSIDLSEPNSSATVKAFISEHDLDISILVNNSGYGLWGRFEKLSLKDQLNMLRLNNESLISLTYAFLPQLQRQKQSYILNVASTTAYQAVPFMSVYAASKSFVVSFSRGLTAELKKSNVSVTCLSPGATTTGFMDRAGMDSEKIIKASEKVSMSSSDVAVQAVNALFGKKTEFIPGFINKLAAFATNVIPKSIIENIASGIYHKD